MTILPLSSSSSSSSSSVLIRGKSRLLLIVSMTLVLLRSVVTVSEAAAASGFFQGRTPRWQPFSRSSRSIYAGSTLASPAMFVHVHSVVEHCPYSSSHGGVAAAAGQRRPLVVLAPPRPRNLGRLDFSGYGRRRWRGDAGRMTRYATGGGRSNIDESDEHDNNEDDNKDDSTIISRNFRPFEWEELQEIITNHPPRDRSQRLAELYRSPNVQEAYQDHRMEILQDYESLMDYILVSKLQQDRQWNVNTQKWKVIIAGPSTTTAGPVLALRRNDYPYCVAHPIEHWVLWKWWGGDPCDDEEASSSSSSNASLISISEEEIQEAVETILRSSLSFEKDVLYWENPPHLQSLPEIRHVHILIRGPTKEEQTND